MNVNGDTHDGAAPVPESARRAIAELTAAAGGEWTDPYPGSIGRTMYDTPLSEDGTVTVLLPPEKLAGLPAQALVRIGHPDHEDGRVYLGAVVKGPFAEPDGLRADAPIIVTTAVRGAMPFLPRYHGRVQVQVVGEVTANGTTVTPRYRPLPNSPVFALDAEETASALGIRGSVRLGTAVGHDIAVTVPADSKMVFPRHTAVLGTTGGGKSTTVAGMIAQLHAANMAVIVLDTEGEYTRINEPSDDPSMVAALRAAGMEPAGVPDTVLFHLVGRETANAAHPRRRRFTLRFSELSPYAVMDILDLSEPQEQRFLKAYDVCKRLLWDFNRPQTAEGRRAIEELDEFETGYPGMTLDHLYDVVRLAERLVAGEPPAAPVSPDFHGHEDDLKKALAAGGKAKQDSITSWRALLGKLGRLRRLKVFDIERSKEGERIAGLPYAEMAVPGAVSVIDLSGTDSPQVNNLAIAELLRGVQEQQEAAARHAEQTNTPLTPVVVFVEEAHEFLSAERAARMQHLFEQVARIARRGRKRWLGLVFITQLPQHLPDEVFGLVNNYVLHKIGDAGVISRLKRSVPGIDEALWLRLPGLAPGQAVLAFTSLTRPLLVAIDPAPCKLRMVE
jgi:DNA helicase HerA-like ATPase